MNHIKTTTDIIYNDNAKKDIIIVHISDIHFHINTKVKKLNKLAKYINIINPNYIIITGDIIDSHKIIKNNNKIKELVNFLSDLGKKSKVIISLGNHDILKSDDYQFFNKLNDLYNIYVLNNTSYHDEYIYAFGITLPSSYYYNVTGIESAEVLYAHLDKIKDEFKKAPKNLPKIALIHSPIRLTENNNLNLLKTFDLILTGHTHNGMVPPILKIFFRGNTGIISPRNELFPKIAKGKIEKNIGNKKITIIINGAITKFSYSAGIIFRQFNFIYNIDINKIIIRKKRGIKYE